MPQIGVNIIPVSKPPMNINESIVFVIIIHSKVDTTPSINTKTRDINKKVTNSPVLEAFIETNR